MDVACGQCMGCRVDRSQVWAARIVHEAQMHDENSFITLTYSDENLPPDGSLVKSHFQKFMKRLRKKFEPRRIRYYQCGEYGDQLGRPHYHAILFGLDFEDKQLLGEENGESLYTSPMLTQVWGLGFTTVGAVTFESAAYVARYAMKKVTGHKAEDHYLRCDENGVAYWLEPEYATMSRRPGIGREWYEKYKSDVFPSDEVPVPGRGVHKGVPRYYETLLKDEDEITWEDVKRRRKAYREENPDEYQPGRLMDKYKVKKAQISKLRRPVD